MRTNRITRTVLSLAAVACVASNVLPAKTARGDDAGNPLDVSPAKETGAGNPLDTNSSPAPVAKDEKGLCGFGIGGNDQGQPIVARVLEGGPAEKAGLHVGDILLRVAGKTMETYGSNEELLDALQGKTGTTCAICVQRGDRVIDVVVTRAALTKPAGPDRPRNDNPAPHGPQVTLPNDFKPDIDPTNILLTVIPREAMTAPPPSVLKPGLEIVYYLGSSVVPGEAKQWNPNANGNYTGPNGQTYSFDDNPSVGGAGWHVFDVGYVDDRVVVGASREYTVDTTDTRFGVPQSAAGAVLPAGFGGESWVNPQVLNAMPEQRTGELLVHRMAYRLGQRDLKVLRIAIKTDDACIDYTFDLETGLLVHYGSISQGKGGLVPGPNGTALPGKGATTAVSMLLLETRQLDLPWANQPAPDWARRVREMKYEGATINILDGTNFDLGAPMSSVVTCNAATEVWARSDIHTTQGRAGGGISSESDWKMVQGVGPIPHCFASPTGLAKLKPDQILIEDNIVGSRIAVTQADEATVTLSEIGHSFRQDFTYDRRTGAMTSATQQRRMGAGTIGFKVRLTGQE